MHLGPIRIQLLGHQKAQRAVHTLPHFGAWHDHANPAVWAHAHPAVQGSGARLTQTLAGGRGRNAQKERPTGASHQQHRAGRSFEEGAALHGLSPRKAAAADSMAARTRW